MKKYQYRAIHTAIIAVYGKPTKCELCKGKKKSKRFEWSNKNHKYTLLKKDWWQLCAKCHRGWDAKKFGKKAWNKALKGLQPWHNVKGLLGEPWNKNKKMSRQQRDKLSKAHLGIEPWNKGKTYKHKRNTPR